MRGLGVAIQLLTRLPVPWPRTHRADDLVRSLPWLPLVGALVGGLMGLCGLGLVHAGLPTGVALVLMVALGPLLTGALHEDGLADTADGLLGGRDRDRRLEILRDSRVGAYGLVALILAFALRVEVLRSLPVGGWPVALAVAHALGRLATVRLMAALPYARQQAPGLGASMAEGARGWRPAVAGLVGLALAIGLGGLGGALAALTMVALTLLLAAWYRRALGGVTGDLLGAACVIVEIGALCTLTVTP